MKQNNKRKQILENALYGLEIIFNLNLKKFQMLSWKA